MNLRKVYMWWCENLDQYHQTEYVMTFLMGLSESFTPTRGQVLLMDLIPPINRVFALISQEEKQRTMVGQSYLNQDPTNNVTMLAKSYSKIKHHKRDKPICTYCKIPSHTVDKCYKLHGFPLGYKPKIKGQVNAVRINSVEAQNSRASIGQQDSGKPKKFSVSSLSVDQCNQLIGMLSTHMVASASSIEDVHSASFTVGTYAVNNYGSFSSSNSIWIID